MGILLKSSIYAVLIFNKVTSPIVFVAAAAL